MGAGGGQIARRVGDSLGWEVLDKEIVETLANQYGTSRVVLDAVDEKKVGWLADMFNGWIEGHGFSQLSYVHRLGHLFNMAAWRGNVVIVGRGARFKLPRNAGLSVRIVAPFDFRVEQLVLRNGLSAAEARKLVTTSDLDRQAFIDRYFHQQITNPHTHDLIVNVEQLVQDDAVRLIVDAVHAWVTRLGFRNTPP
jgi:cytidylate kinase